MAENTKLPEFLKPPAKSGPVTPPPTVPEPTFASAPHPDAVLAVPKNLAPAIAAPAQQIVYVASPPVHIPPEPNITPEGGRFGIREYQADPETGKRVETIKWVSAFGLPFSENAELYLRASR